MFVPQFMLHSYSTEDIKLLKCLISLNLSIRNMKLQVISLFLFTLHIILN